MRVLIIANMDIGLYKFRKELIEELLNKKGGMVSLARQELRRRYIENDQEDKTKIALAFAQSSVRDNNWLESQMRKELYGIG